jgi:hypothetical protein
LSNLKLNLNFFKDKKGMSILPEYLDGELNKVVDYINDDLIPYLESVQTAVVGGVLGDPYSVLCNINNQDTGYLYLNNINFDDNLLSISKLKQSDAGSIIASSTDGSVIAITPEASNLLLFGSLVRPLKFRKIRSDDLSNNVITGDKLQILAANNFVDNIFINIIPNNSITENQLSNISNAKIANGCIDFRHLGIFGDLFYDLNVANQLLLDDFDDNSINSIKFKDASIGWDNFIEATPIYADNLVPMHITDSYLIPYVADTALPNLNIADLKASNFSSIINFPSINVQNVRLTAAKIALGSVSKEYFDAEVRDAIETCIEIKEGAGFSQFKLLTNMWNSGKIVLITKNIPQFNSVNYVKIEIFKNFTDAFILVELIVSPGATPATDAKVQFTLPFYFFQNKSPNKNERYGFYNNQYTFLCQVAYSLNRDVYEIYVNWLK